MSTRPDLTDNRRGVAVAGGMDVNEAASKVQGLAAAWPNQAE